MALTRRRALALGAAGALSALSGCTSLVRAYRVVAPTLTLPPSPLRGWDAAVREAWGSGGGMFALSPIEGGNPSVAPDATWVAEATAGTSVGPLLRGANLPIGTLASWALDAFTDTSGTLTALPMAIGQLQFYVNSVQLKAVGISAPEAWTWEDL